MATEHKIVKNPFPGLYAYRSTQAPDFFGRDRLKHKLLKQFISDNFLIAVGDSGVGKSSLLSCEIVARLGKGYPYRGVNDWVSATFKPGDSPLFSLSQALVKLELLKTKSDQKIDSNLENKFRELLKGNKYGIVDIVEQFKLTKDQNLVLFIDDIDDLITYNNSSAKEKEIGLFVEQLVQVISQRAYPILIVASATADQLSKFSVYPALAELINKHQFLVPAFSSTNTMDVFDGVIHSHGLRFETDFLTEVKDHYRTNEFSLVKFQHAIKRSVDLWMEGDQVEGVGLKELKSIGGLSQSIPNQLESIYKDFKPEQQIICELMFRALTSMNDAGAMNIRIVPIDELAFQTGYSVTEIISVAQQFIEKTCGVLQINESNDYETRLRAIDKGDEKLSASTELKVSQKTILYGWSRLTKWVNAEKNKAAVYLNLAKDSDSGEALYEGEKLSYFVKWIENENPHNEWASRYNDKYVQAFTFYDQSFEAEEARKKRRITEINTQNKKANKFRRNMLIFSFFTGLLVFMSWFFGDQALEEKKMANLAKKQAMYADSVAKVRNLNAIESFEKAKKAITLAGEESERAEFAKNRANQLNIENRRTQIQILKMNKEIEASRKEITYNLRKLDKAKDEIELSKEEIKQKEIVSQYLEELAQIHVVIENGAKVIANNLYNEGQVVLGGDIAMNAYQRYKKLESKYEQTVRDTDLEQKLENDLMKVLGLAFQHIDNNDFTKRFKDKGVIYGVKLAKHPLHNEVTLGTNEGKLFTVKVDKNDPFNSFEVGEYFQDERKMIDGIRDLHYSASGDVVYYSTVEGHLRVAGTAMDVVPEGSGEQIPSMVLVHRFENGDMMSFSYNSSIYFAQDGSSISHPIKTFSSPIVAVDYNSEKNIFILASGDGTIQKLPFDQTNQKLSPGESFVVPDLHSSISSIEYIVEKNTLVIGTAKGEIIIYSLSDGGSVLFHDDNEHASRVNCIYFDSKNQVIVSGGNDEVINVWEYERLMKSVDEKFQYSPIKFLEQLPVQDILFVNDSWFMTITRGTSVSEGEGRVSIWSINVDELGEQLSYLLKNNKHKSSESDIKKFTEE